MNDTTGAGLIRLVRTGLVAAILVATASTSSALGELNVGEKGPDFKAGKWYHLPGSMKKLTLSDLKGQIVLVAFWTIWDDHSSKVIPHLVRLHQKYRSRGVIIVAITEDGKSKVTPYIEKEKVNFIVASEGRPTFIDYGVDKVPSAFLLDPDGVIAWKGHPAVIEDEILRLLKEKPPKKGGLFSERSASAALKDAEKLFKEKRYVEAMSAYEKIMVDFKGSATATKARDQIRKMKKNSNIMDVIRRAEGQRLCEGWLEIARACARHGEKRDAVRYYDKIIKKYPGLDIARLARQERTSLTLFSDEKKSDGDDDGSAGPEAGSDEDGEDEGDEQDDE